MLKIGILSGMNQEITELFGQRISDFYLNKLYLSLCL